MTLKEYDIPYTEQQAQDLDRGALEAQYRADTRQSPPVHEYAEWQRVRRAAAERRFHDYLVVPAFSEGNLGPTRVFLPAGEGGIEHDSILVCDGMCCLDCDFLDFGTGPLSCCQ